MLFVSSRCVGGSSCWFLILPMTSRLSFEVSSVVVGVHIAHIILVVVVRMTWLQILFGWLEELSAYSCW